jgi:hypothetical protein
MQPGPNGEQVTDFAYDEDSGLLAVGPEPAAVDIITIKYAAKTVRRVTTITGIMKVSDLSAIPPNTTWRMYFAANAPETGIVTISGNSYSKDYPMMAINSLFRLVRMPAVCRLPVRNPVREFSGSTADTIVTMLTLARRHNQLHRHG